VNQISTSNFAGFQISTGGDSNDIHRLPWSDQMLQMLIFWTSWRMLHFLQLDGCNFQSQQSQMRQIW